MNDEDRNFIPKEEALVKLKKAVFLTKGLCNNDDALQIARRANSTVDDIVRLGSYKKLEQRLYYRPLQGSPRHRFNSIAQRIQSKRVVKLVDTVVWRYWESKGLTKIATEKYHLQNANASDCIYKGYGYRSDAQKGYAELMNFAKLSTSEAIMNNHSISEGLMKVNHGAIREVYKNNPAYVDYYDGREEFYKAEVDWMSHAPQDILDRLNPTISYASMTQCMWNMQGSIRSGVVTDMTGFKAREYARQMARYMKYMGIGVAGIGGYSWGIVRNRKNTQALAKFMMTVKNKFDQMIKKGFDVSLVREEMVNSLNNWVSTKCVIDWTFFIRTDAPSEYPELIKQRKVKKLHRSGSASPTIITVSDDEAKVVKLANGTEIKFNRKEAK